MADKTIWVKSGRQDARVALWERDPRHPGGEVFVAASEPVTGQTERANPPQEAFPTAEVQRLLGDGTLVEAEAPSGEERAAMREANERAARGDQAELVERERAAKAEKK